MSAQHLSRCSSWLLVLAASTSLEAQTLREWPGAPPCAGTFNECLAAVPAGGTVRIVASSTIAERFTLNRSLTIEAAPGVIAAFTADETHLIDINATQPWAVTLRRIFIDGGSLDAVINGGQPGELTLEASKFRGNAADSQSQLGVVNRPANSGRSRLVIRRCEFEIGSDNNAFTSIRHSGAGTGGMEVLVEDNRFRPEPVVMVETSHRAWYGSMSGSGSWQFVFRRNRILPAIDAPAPGRRYAGGFEVYNFDTVHIDLAVHDNLIMLDRVAGAGGKAVSGGGASGGTVQARVVNNTIIDATYASAFGPNVSGRWDNNIAVNGFRIHDGSAPSSNFQRRGNLEFGYDHTGWPTAPGTVTSDPQLAPDGRPRPGSPALNAGSNLARNETGPGLLGVPADLDLDGLRRTEGGEIDIGAYEGERIHYDGIE